MSATLVAQVCLDHSVQHTQPKARSPALRVAEGGLVTVLLLTRVSATWPTVMCRAATAAGHPNRH